MSHRITVKSKMTDRELLGEVLNAKGIAHSESNGVFRITGGPLRNSSIDSNSGDIVGDSDYQGRGVLGSLRPAYTEAKLRKQCMIDGVEIEARQETTESGQNVIEIITTHMGMAVG